MTIKFSDNSLVNCIWWSRGGETEVIPPEHSILGQVLFDKTYRAPTLDKGYPVVTLEMPDTNDTCLSEVWTTPAKVECGHEDPLVFSHDGTYLFCAAKIAIHEQCRAEVCTTYLAAFTLIDKLGYKNLVRIWNYIPDLNQENNDGLEVYRDFCVGRAEAFDIHHSTGKNKVMPATTCIGTHGGDLIFYFLAGRSGEIQHLENPRQLPAYTYPKQYSPRSPSFARATYMSNGDKAHNKQIFVSGTASIIGHETVHCGKVVNQLDVALENIALLVGQSNLTNYGISAQLGLKDLDLIKVYVRNAKDIPVVKERCDQIFPKHQKIAFFNADICRTDLLVELEGIIHRF